MNKVLILDTSSAFLFVSIVVDQKEVFKEVINAKNNHSEKLLDVVMKGLEETSNEVKDFNSIVVGIGPGAYTGLRVSLTVAKMFSWTLNIPLYTISSLDVLGSGMLNKDGIYAVLNDAKKDYIYGKVFEIKNNKYQLLEADGFFLKEDYLKMIEAKYPSKVLIYQDYGFSGLNIYNRLNDNNPILTKVDDVHPLVPNYLRKEI